jgi:hypothetical protein
MARIVRRPYLAAAGLALTGVATAAALIPLAQARALFESRPIPASQVIVLAQPLAGNRWKLVLLEQRQAEIPCWQSQRDGTVLSLADGVRNETYCGRYSSSGAYSLRVAGNDLNRPWQLKLEQGNDLLQLQATSSQTRSPIVVGQAPIPTALPGPNTLVPLTLDEGWELERRSYNGRPLSHIYLSNGTPLPMLVARSRSGGPLLAMPPAPPPPLLASSRSATASLPTPAGRGERITGPSRRIALATSTPGLGEVIALEVIPFRD